MSFVKDKRASALAFCDVVYVINGTVTPLMGLVLLVEGYIGATKWVLAGAVALMSLSWVTYIVVSLSDSWKERRRIRDLNKIIQKSKDPNVWPEVELDDETKKGLELEYGDWIADWLEG